MVLQHIADPKLAVIIALIFSRFKASTFRIPFIGILFNLMGTFLHETSHLLTAVLFNGKPSRFSLIPKRQGDDWLLGSVEVKNLRWYNAMPIAFAPLLLFLGAYFLDGWYSALPIAKTIWTDLGYLFGLVILVDNAIPSTQDIKVALSNIFGVLFYSVAFTYIFIRISTL